MNVAICYFKIIRYAYSFFRNFILLVFNVSYNTLTLLSINVSSYALLIAFLLSFVNLINTCIFLSILLFNSIYDSCHSHIPKIQYNANLSETIQSNNDYALFCVLHDNIKIGLFTYSVYCLIDDALAISSLT